MSNIVIFGATQSGKTTLLGYLATAMLRHPQLNDEILQKLKLIKQLTSKDEFHIGNPYNPVNVTKGIILPSFVSLDRDELRKFTEGQTTEGTTKRLHRKQLSICVSERNDIDAIQNENANVPCTFIDIPGFRQRLSDKYRGFYEGDVGIAVLKLQELLELWSILENGSSNDTKQREEELERRLFEPIRIWCDYRSPARLVIVISQIDRSFDRSRGGDAAAEQQKKDIQKAIDCIHLYTSQFSKQVHIPISPISINLTSEPNIKEHHRMAIFFHREEENIYSDGGKEIPGDGTLIKCLNKVMPPYESAPNRAFSMASVYKPMRATVNNSTKTALNVRALHGSIHKDDHVFLGPVVDKRTNEIVYAECDISSLKADGTLTPSEVLFEGNVGGIIFKTIKNTNSSTEYHIDSVPKKSDISILKSTILFAGKISEGDIIELEIYKDDYLTVNGHLDEIYSKVLPALMPFDQLVLFWFGKKVSVNVVEIFFHKDKMQLSVIVSRVEHTSTRCFALPCDNSNTLKHHDNVLLAIPQSFYSPSLKQNIYTYVTANIVKLKNSTDFNAIRIKANPDMELDVLFKDNLFFERSVAEEEADSFCIPIKSLHKHISIYSVLTRVGRCLRSHFGRVVYRDYGGVTITLMEDGELGSATQF